jgi:hypothetical protein
MVARLAPAFLLGCGPMGVLDDAIREHIELKRQHGANLSELERQEHEALGPARREAPSQPSEGESAEDDAVEAEAQETELLAEPAEPEEFQEPATPDVPEFDVPARPSVVDEPPLEEEPLPPPEEDPLPPPAPPPAEAPEAEDVLEETPEFLQETPEHDRLWFEQRPPRDFDFDDDDR